MKASVAFKKQIDAIKTELLDGIKMIVTKQPNERLEIYDVDDNLVLVEDLQSPTIIMSIETRENRLTGNYGTYEEEDYVILENCNVELLCIIFDACERAEDDLKREKQVDENIRAGFN